jgi:hypothetical protein
MEARKFKIGERVEVHLDNLAANSSLRDIYTISQTLPSETNVWQYRVKRVGDNQERAVSEHQLSKLASVTTNRSENEIEQDLHRIRNANARARARKGGRSFALIRDASSGR